ncbi:MAG: 3-hydroxyacyl-CoA dehydrogenase family protein [Bacteroidales bacterium]|nr:3-hydroxyacyl-CoA dehydrogenase family protein [Bacteroidales bacterium]
MEYSKRLSNVSVLGAAGKMGSGILLLMSQELYDLSKLPENEGLDFRLNAIDVSEEGLQSILKYIEKQTRKSVERKPENIRKYFSSSDLTDEEMKEEYVKAVLAIIHPSINLMDASDSTLVFEAASEDKDLKVKLFSDIDKNSDQSPWFFTNTSSIPIQYIDEKANLNGRVLGFHFYNPPAIQKLVELITTGNTEIALKETAYQLAKRLRKIIVPSNDVAGFIGNGHFMRDALYAISEVERLSGDMDYAKALYTINTVSQKFLIRPMGIFQLCDYVGIDVVQFILKVMNPYMPEEDLHSDLLDKMVDMGVKGGQNPDGSQKDGFLKYDMGKITGVFDMNKEKYIDVQLLKNELDKFMGPLPEAFKPWKEIIRDPEKDKLLNIIFSELKQLDTTGAELAFKYGLRSKEIGLNLVKDKVSNTEEDVNKVLLTGFYHAYGPINNYFDK